MLMSYLKNKELILILFFAGVFTALSVTFVERLLATVQQQHVDDERKKTTLLVLTAKNTLENTIISDTYVGSSVATLATVAPETLQANWHAISEQFLETATSARSIALLPNDIIGYIAPLKNNERALGLDLRNYPDQYKTVEQAKQTQEVVIAGPIELVQGGLGVVIRYPVFSDFPYNKDYWGSISVVIDFEKLIEKSGLTDINTADIALRGRDARGVAGDVFWGTPSVFNSSDIEFPIIMPNGSWLIGATYKNSAFTPDLQTRILRITMYFVSILTFVGLLLFYQAYKRSMKEAYHDELTGLANRRHAIKKLQELAELPRNKSNYALLNIDLNGFKRVNDSYGHTAGDSLLKFVANGLKTQFRSSDFVARMGGDEFIVVMYRIETLQKATLHVEMILDYFKGHKLNWNGVELIASLSVGIAHSSELDGHIEDLQMLADKRMYKQKTIIGS